MRIDAQINGQPEEDNSEFIAPDEDKNETSPSQKEIIFQVQTAREIGSSVSEVLVQNRTDTSIVLKWKLNPCANDYLITNFLSGILLV